MVRLLILLSSLLFTVTASTIYNKHIGRNETNSSGELAEDDKCDGILCRNGGTCIGGICACVEHVSGGQCENIDCMQLLPECYESGGDCEYAILGKESGVMECICPPPKFLFQETNRCEDKCEGVLCRNGGTCQQGVCECIQHVSGGRCENVDCADILPRCHENGGFCHYDEAAEGNMVCDCPITKFYDEKTEMCEDKRPIGDTTSGSSTTKKDFCIPNPCVNGTCVQFENRGFFCKCNEPFTGYLCNETTSVIDPCHPNPCKNGGVCYVDGEATCMCKRRFHGKFCEERRKLGWKDVILIPLVIVAIIAIVACLLSWWSRLSKSG